jgi:adenine phosphoribosyltransferase
MDLRSCIRDIPDFPKEGILFKDITPLLLNPEAFEAAMDAIEGHLKGHEFDKIAAIESRGFPFGAALALRRKCGLILVRKPGKLPADTISQSFDLEYGQDTLEMHRDAITPGEKILIIDDLLATGGTLEASAKLVEQLQGEVTEIVTLVELTFLHGRERIKDYPFYACMEF